MTTTPELLSPGTVTFQDLGMLRKTVEFANDNELNRLLEAEALKMNYTRAHIEPCGSRTMRWSTARGVTFVRAIGSYEWKDWAEM